MDYSLYRKELDELHELTQNNPLIYQKILELTSKVHFDTAFTYLNK